METTSIYALRALYRLRSLAELAQLCLPIRAPRPLELLPRNLEPGEFVEVQRLVAQHSEFVGEPALIMPNRRTVIVHLDLAQHHAGLVRLEVPPRKTPRVVRVAPRLVPVAFEIPHA